LDKLNCDKSQGGIAVNTKEAIANRILQLCDERNIAVNELANTSAVSPSTVYSMLNEKKQNPGTITIKKLCDGLEITLGEFFSTPEFDALEQEIK
jgi:DNA-binding Xre family transcriptional regulator